MSDPTEFEAAADTLYGVPLRAFTAERKRLAAELRKAGDRAGGAQLAKLARPTMSAWVVNQLYRQARTQIDALLAAAARIRAGQLDAASEQRAALTRLRALGAEVLRGDGHASSEQTLARVMTTLQALAAVGSFAPDRAGRLVVDRDPPGFEAMAAFGAAVSQAEQASASAAPASETPAPAARGVRPAGTPESTRAARAPEMVPRPDVADAEHTARARESAAREEATRRQAQQLRESMRKQHEADVERARRLLERNQRELEVRAAALEQQRVTLERARVAHAEADAAVAQARGALAEAQARLVALSGPG